MYIKVFKSVRDSILVSKKTLIFKVQYYTPYKLVQTLNNRWR